MNGTPDIDIKRGTPADIGGVEALYDDLNDYLASHTNNAGWRKGVYPTREVAERAVAANTLYVARLDNRIIGTIILNHEPEPNYDTVPWPSGASNDEAFVIHTLAVHPDDMRHGVARLLLKFAYDQARRENMKALRLDVNDHNLPAIALYEGFGFGYVATIDLGLGAYGLDWFKVYELAVSRENLTAQDGEPPAEFENRFRITRELYMDWVRHPIKNSRRRFIKIAWIVLFAVCAGVTIFLLLSGSSITYLFLFIIFTLFCGYRAFFRNRVIADRQFSQAVYMQGSEGWERVTTFSGDITVADGCSVTQFDYDKVTELVDNRDFLALGIGEGADKSYLRLAKNGFAQRTYQEFIEFFGQKRPDIKIIQ